VTGIHGRRAVANVLATVNDIVALSVTLKADLESPAT
jgi:hypothetical protein